MNQVDGRRSAWLCATPRHVGVGRAAGVALAAAIALMLAAGARLGAEPSSTPRLDWLFDGHVLTTARIGDVVYVGGNFQNVSPTSGALGHLFALSPSTGVPVPGPPIVNGTVSLIELDGAGGFFIAGQFTNFGSNGGGDPSLGTFQLAHIRSDGSADPVFAPSGIIGGLAGMVRVGSSLVLRGFLTVNGTHRSLVALDPVTGAVKPWTANLPPLLGREPSIPALVGANGVMYAIFISDANLGRRVAAIDGTTGATLWTSQVVGPTGMLPGGALAAGASRVVISVDKLYALDAATGAIDTSWAAAQTTPAGVSGLELSGDTLYVSGTFTSLLGQPRTGLAAIDLPSGQLLPWAPSVSFLAPPVSIAVAPSGAVFAAGTVCVTGTNQCRVVIVQFDSAGALTGWAPQVTLGLNVTTMRYSPAGALLVATQQMSKTGAVARKALAAFDANSGALLTGAPAVDGSISPFMISVVDGLVADGTVLYISGIFSSVNGVARQGLAAVDTSANTVRPWAPLWPSFPPPQVTFAIAGRIYLTSRATSGWTMRRVDAVTGADDAAWTPPPIVAAAVESGQVVAARDLRAGVNVHIGTAVGGLDPVSGAFGEWFRSSAVSYWGDELRPFGGQLALAGGTVYLAGPRSDGDRFNQRSLSDTVVAFDRTTGVRVTPSVIGYINGVSVADGRPIIVGGRMVSNGRERRELGEVSLPDGFTAWRPAWPLFDAPVYLDFLSSFSFIRGAHRAQVAGDLLLVTGLAVYDDRQGRVAAFALSGASVPSNLRSQIAGPNTVFTWDGMTPPPAGGYVIEGGFAAGQAAAALPVGNATSIALPMPPGPLFIRVRPQGSAEVSNEIVAGCLAPPLPPTALTTTLNGTALTLAWTAPAGAVANYTLLAGTATGLSDAATLALGPLTSISGTVPGGTFFARVTATNACGTSGPSGEVFFTIGAPDPLPAAPANPAASVSGSTVTLSWTAPAGPVTGYVIEAGTGSGLANLGTLQIGASSSIVLPGVPAGTYAVRLRAITSAGSGAPSADVVVDVP